jgi:adenosylcobyric acid synthase
VVPGVSALQAAAAVLGAPLMHDFAVISLSDLLTPWDAIERRLKAAAAADFVVAIYNPRSKGRVRQIERARELLLAARRGETPVGIVRNACRSGEERVVTTLAEMLDHPIDMFSLVMVGNSATFVDREGRMITPRGYAAGERLRAKGKGKDTECTEKDFSFSHPPLALGQGAARAVMICGTGSDVGKSVLTAGLCRILKRRGLRVAPFKSQNMALNSAVTLDGGEIGRAQAAQAEAAGLEPTVDMNPILLKPEADHRSQLVVRGGAVASVTFGEYRRMTPGLMSVVEASLERLRRAYDLVLIEGAGSPAEINLREDEIVNMRVARLAEAPVLLVGDIDRGGVFAAFVGTLALLPPEDRALVAGFVVNKFRGEVALLAPGLDELTARTGVPVLGVVPHAAPRLVPAEDSLELDGLAHETGPATLTIAVVRLPRISNFDDFEPLAREPAIRLRLAGVPEDLEGADLIVLPGSKSTAEDLGWLRWTGLATAITTAAGGGRSILGICGGFQMLGVAVHDPHDVESGAGTTPGLGLLPAETWLEPEKSTVRVRAHVGEAPGLFAGASGRPIDAYEIHAGRTEVRRARRPFDILARQGVTVVDRDGASSESGHVVGTYLHGLFANDALRRAVLTHLAGRRGLPPDPRWGTSTSAAERYDQLADLVAAACDLDAIGKLVGLEWGQAFTSKQSTEP